MAARNYPLGKRGQIIGTPGKGTHSKAFNVKGGSNNWESENAYDIAVPDGTPVYAVTSGTIGSQIGSTGEGGRFAGERLHLVTGGNEFYYAHLSKITVHAGEQVQAGQLLGYSGSANGVAHLHFASKTGNPAAWFSSSPDQNGTAAASEPPATSTPTPAAPGQSTTVPTSQAQVPDTVPSPVDTQPYQPDPGSGLGSASRYVQDLWSRIQATSPDTQLLQQNSNLIGG